MTGFAEGYVDVAQRVQKFKETYPEGSLQSARDPYVLEVKDKTYVVYAAAAYRSPDDPRPGIGYAWELVPGPTPYTKDSELQNAETSAWGRAIAALGFEVHNGIATKEEVKSAQARQSDPESGGDPAKTYAEKGDSLTDKQLKYARMLLNKFPADVHHAMLGDCKKAYGKDLPELSKREATEFIDKVKRYGENAVAAGPATTPDSDIPFL
jgi:hypothetical protein